MSLNYEAFIGLRYLRARRRNGFISFISLLSVYSLKPTLAGRLFFFASTDRGRGW